MTTKVLRALESDLIKRCNLRYLANDVYIGKPDKLSNIRPLVFKHNKNDTKLEKSLKDVQFKAQQWHHNFWSEHNQKYVKSRETYQQSNGITNQKDVDSMATFHQHFLFENNAVLKKYDKEWKKLNRKIIYLMAASTVQRFFINIFQFLKVEKN